MSFPCTGCGALVSFTINDLCESCSPPPLSAKVDELAEELARNGQCPPGMPCPAGTGSCESDTCWLSYIRTHFADLLRKEGER